MSKWLLVNVLLFTLICCGDTEHYPNTNINYPGGGPAFHPVGDSCDTMIVLDCVIYLPEHGHVEACLKGHQYCENFRWSQCKN